MNTITRNSEGYYFIKSNDLLAFDGIGIKKNYLRKEEGDRRVILERYFNDIYKLFLNKLTGIAMGEKLTNEEQERMKKLLDEIIKVRELLEEKEGKNKAQNRA